MAEPNEMVIPLLREMPADVAALRLRIDECFDENDKAHTTFGHALAGDSLVGRLLTGEFEERVEKLETHGDRNEKLENKFRAFEGRS